LKKGDRFVVVGTYPSFWNSWSLSRFFNPEVFGKIYHETCYSQFLKEEEPKQKEQVKP
jgi:hypothetical protein